MVVYNAHNSKRSKRVNNKISSNENNTKNQNNNKKQTTNTLFERIKSLTINGVAIRRSQPCVNNF